MQKTSKYLYWNNMIYNDTRSLRPDTYVYSLRVHLCHISLLLSDTVKPPIQDLHSNLWRCLRRLSVQLCREQVLPCLLSGKHALLALSQTGGLSLKERLFSVLQKSSLAVSTVSIFFVTAWSSLFWEESLASSSLTLKTIRVLLIWIGTFICLSKNLVCYVVGCFLLPSHLLGK